MDNIKIAKIILFKYLYLIFLDLENMIQFKILVIKKIKFKYFAILYILFDKYF